MKDEAASQVPTQSSIAILALGLVFESRKTKKIVSTHKQNTPSDRSEGVFL